MNLEIVLTARDQIGFGNVLAISGGKWSALDEHTLVLPIKYGYRVEVTYERYADTYTVRRVLQRGTKRTVQFERADVYAEQVGEVAYRASLYA